MMIGHHYFLNCFFFRWGGGHTPGDLSLNGKKSPEPALSRATQSGKDCTGPGACSVSWKVLAPRASASLKCSHLPFSSGKSRRYFPAARARIARIQSGEKKAPNTLSADHDRSRRPGTRRVPAETPPTPLHMDPPDFVESS